MRGDDEDSVPQATQEGVRQKIGNKHVHSRKYKKKKKKTTALSLTPLSTPPPSSLFPSFSLTPSLLGEA